TSRWPNVLGLGKVFRPLIVPDPGCGLGEADWSQIEVGIAAAVYNDDRLTELFNSDDVYSAMAKEFARGTLRDDALALPGSEFKKRHRPLRDQMKTCTLGMIYGLTPHGLALKLNISEPAAEALQKRFMGMFPQLQRGLAEARANGGLRGYAAT